VLTAWDQLENLLTGGVALGGAISRQILEAIFRKMSPVHDGAVIVEDGRIARVGVFLPLTRREDLPLHFNVTRFQEWQPFVLASSSGLVLPATLVHAQRDRLPSRAWLFTVVANLQAVQSFTGWHRPSNRLPAGDKHAREQPARRRARL
jgi:DisA bacterial checkpoint controller nucleotide-binding